ncbi:hypothetical protein [Planomicrobium okeanokoites]|uniref:hypothetical protein n=1 Tax=Planomicrobium okeanokoites TaxID=244 RepID=UPI0030FA7CB7
MRYKLYGPGLLNQIENSFNTQFENYVQLILLTGLGGYRGKTLGVRKYRDTRAEKDNGIDGFIKRGNTKYEIFSIYGPKHTTSWQNKFKKISEDYVNAKKFCEDKEYTFIKWHMVLNFNINENQEQAILNLAEEDDIEAEIYTPKRLFQLLASEEDYFIVAKGMGKAQLLDAPLEDLSHSKFADVALQNFISFENEGSFDEKLSMVQKTRQEIYYRTFINLTEEEIKETKFPLMLTSQIRRKTEIHPKYYQTYQYFINENGLGDYYPIEENTISSLWGIQKNKEGFQILIKDLAIIHRITTEIERILFDRGAYKLRNILHYLADKSESLRGLDKRKIN